MTRRKLGKVLGCRVTEEEEQGFSRIAAYLDMTGSELLRWFVGRAIEAEQAIMEEIREKGGVLPAEAFLAQMDGRFSTWFHEAFLATNWIQRPEEIQAVGLKLLDLAQRFRLAKETQGGAGER